MWLTRLTIAAATTLALAICFSGTVLADDAKSSSDVKPDELAQVDEPLPPDGPPRPGFGGAGFGGPGPFGPRERRGMGQAGEGQPPCLRQPSSPGMGRGGPGMGQGGPGMGRGGPGNRPDQIGQGSTRQQDGPPRWPHQNWNDLQKNDPEMYKWLSADRDLDARARQTAFQYRRAPGGERAAIREKLEQLLGEHFEVRQQRRLLELKRLEEELERLREAIDLRKEARKELVGKRLRQLIGEEQGLDF